MMVWDTMYTIASKRHNTKIGHKPLSEKALHVVHTFVAHEKAVAMAEEIRKRQEEFMQEIFGGD